MPTWPAGGKSLQLWDLSAAEDPISLEGHTSFINRLEVSDDNQILISASADKTVRLWDIPTQTWKATLAGHQSFVNDVMVDGPRLWSADESPNHSDVGSEPGSSGTAAS